MGSYQTKCGCGEFSQVEMIATCDYSQVEPTSFSFGLDMIQAKSGYRMWSTAPFIHDKPTFKAYPCNRCADKIGDRLDLADGIDYTMTESAKGYWRTDLP